jgi:pheromone shutdown protein TraB
MELICGDVLECNAESSSLDFIFAALVFEYLDPKAALKRFAEWLAPRGVLAVILQLPCDQGKVTATKYTSVNCLESVIQLVEPGHLTALASAQHLNMLTSRIETLASGKQFFIGVYERG